MMLRWLCLSWMFGILFLQTEVVSASSLSYGSSNQLRSHSPSFLGTPGGTSLRCGRNLVNIGDHQNAVYDICGDPESINRRTVVVGETVHFPHRTRDLEEYVEVQVEEWIYNFGSNRFRQYLRFENGILVEIRSLGRSR